MKIIKIKNCKECPHYYLDVTDSPYCSLCKRYFLKREKETFPSWCPLEDYKEGK